jgi:basic membrane protein A and related proteins
MDTVILSSSAYFPAAMELATEFPDTNFVSFVGGPAPEDQPENLWLLGLNFHPGEYVLGAIGALESKQGKIAFIGGLELPNLFAGANAYFEGAKAVRKDIELDYVFTGDFDDAAKGRDAAAALIRNGSDVLHIHLNAGVPGSVQASSNAGGVKWTALYTDKNDLGPDSYIGSIVFDFQQGYQEAISAIQEGETTGYLDLGPLIDLTKLYNVSDDVRSMAQDILDDVKSGEIEIEPKPDKVVIP